MEETAYKLLAEMAAKFYREHPDIMEAVSRGEEPPFPSERTETDAVTI